MKLFNKEKFIADMESLGFTAWRFTLQEGDNMVFYARTVEDGKMIGIENASTKEFKLIIELSEPTVPNMSNRNAAMLRIANVITNVLSLQLQDSTFLGNWESTVELFKPYIIKIASKNSITAFMNEDNDEWEFPHAPKPVWHEGADGSNKGVAHDPISDNTTTYRERRK